MNIYVQLKESNENDQFTYKSHIQMQDWFNLVDYSYNFDYLENCMTPEEICLQVNIIYI